MLAGRSSVSQPVYIAVAQPFLSRSWAENGGKLGFWDTIRPFLAPHDLKLVIARQKRAEGAFKVPCCGSSPIVVVVWRYLLDYDPGARTYCVPGYQFSAAGSRNTSETAIATAENAKPAEEPFKAPCCEQHSRFSCFACQYLTTNLVPKLTLHVCRICYMLARPGSGKT